MLLEHLFHFRIDRDPTVPSQDQRLVRLLLSMVYDRPPREPPMLPWSALTLSRGCWLLRGRNRNRGTTLLPFLSEPWP